VPPDEAFDLLEAYGIRRKPGLLRSAGTGVLNVAGQQIALESFVPVAHLPDAWSEAWVAAIAASGARVLTTIENEYPFLAHVEESGGPAGLGASGEVAVYTAGFPTPALVAALRALADRAPDLAFRHWGDADLGGVRIWLYLRTKIGRPLTPFRTTAEWIRTESDHASRKLSPPELQALRHLQSQLASLPGSDVGLMLDAIQALLDTGIKLEQEHF
jgi:hypothetical protein